jgi:hypothetical protein
MNEHWLHCDWLVLPHTPDREAWRASLYKAAADAGRTIFEWDKGGETDWASHPILLTAKVTSALSIQTDFSRIAAVFGHFDVETAEGLSTPARHERVRDVTDGFAQMSLVPPERRFDPIRFSGRPLELLPGLIVSPPPAAPRSTEPLPTALELLLQGQATWPAEIFSWHSPPQRDGDAVVFDLTGRPRDLAFGPYIVLPAGRWKAKFRMTFDDYASRYLFRIDWGRIEQYASQEFRPGRPGFYEFEMTFDWPEREACEFRLHLQEGAFHGEVSLSDLTVTRVS